MFFVLQNP
uniref:Uncharacterized protein n=1 Tax=Arundo donax TaxID=35708 RepID=A0A0A8ZE91_ARUDO